MSDRAIFVDTNIWLYSLLKSTSADERHEMASRLLDAIERPASHS